MKLFIFFFLTSVYLFSANIGFIHPDGLNCVSPSLLKEALERSGHRVEVTSFNKVHKFDLIISINKLTNNLETAKKTILVSMEPKILFKELYTKEITDNYLRVFTFDHKLCESKRYVKMFYPWLVYIDNKVVDRSFKEPWFYEQYPFHDIIKISDKFVPFSDRKLVCLLNSYLKINSLEENYGKRLEIAKFYDEFHPNDLSLYGMKGWEEFNLSIFKGFCDWEKANELFQTHKFCYCYDNWENDVYYISEKIQNCFQNLCVPIYSGCKKIADYIPKETFINANDFNSPSEIHEFISKMDEQTWMGYIQAMQKFVISEESKIFTLEKYVENLVKTVNQALSEG